MADRIFIEQLETEALIGVDPEERLKKQAVIVDIEVEVDTQAIAEQDDIDAALDYRDMAEGVRAFVSDSPGYYLIETLGHHLAAWLNEAYQAEKIKLRLFKPGMICYNTVAGVMIERDFSA